MASGQGITTSSTTISTCENCISTVIPQTVPYSVKQGQFTVDKGSFNVSTSLNGFSWSALKGESLALGLPSVGGIGQSPAQILVNSSVTMLPFLNLNVFFRPQGYQTLITIQGSGLLVPTQVCLPLSATGNQVSYNSTANPTQAIAGQEIFDWSDIPASYNPTYSPLLGLCYTAPAGSYTIDPIALDGSGKCTTGVANTCVVTLTTTNANDVIIVNTACASGGGCGTSTPVDTSSLTWTARTGLCDSGSWANNMANCNTFGIGEYYAIAAGTLAADAITCKDPNPSGKVSCVAFGVSGADTSSTFDSNAAIPCKATASSAGPSSCTFSTSNANDMIVNLLAASGTTCSTPNIGATGMSTIQSECNDIDGGAAAAYLVVSSTQSSVAGTWVLGGSARWLTIIDAIKQASSTVTETITITTLPSGASSATITLVNCGYSNGTLTADGFAHVYTGVTASCATTLRNAAAGANSRYVFNISPHPTSSRNVNFTTASSGSGSYSNSTYYQLSQTYTFTPMTPSTWDGVYAGCTTGPGPCVTGTYLGTANAPQTPPATTYGGGVVTFSTVWFDYGLTVTLGTPIGNTWIAQGNHSFTDTTGGNTHNVNYIQSTGGTSGGAINYFYLPILLLSGTAGSVILGIRKRLNKPKTEETSVNISSLQGIHKGNIL